MPRRSNTVIEKKGDVTKLLHNEKQHLTYSENVYVYIYVSPAQT